MWKDVVGYEGYYQVSDDGTVRSLSKRNYMNNVATRIKNGYYVVELWKKNKCKTSYVHRVVASTFIDNPDNKREVNHIDGVKTNNQASNLEWCTRSENTIHSYNLGLQKRKSKV